MINPFFDNKYNSFVDFFSLSLSFFYSTISLVFLSSTIEIYLNTVRFQSPSDIDKLTSMSVQERERESSRSICISNFLVTISFTSDLLSIWLEKRQIFDYSVFSIERANAKHGSPSFLMFFSSVRLLYTSSLYRHHGGSFSFHSITMVRSCR